MASLGNVQAQLITTTTNPVLTAPGTNQLFFIKAQVVNNDTGPRTVTAYMVPPGGNVGTGTLVLDAFPVTANAPGTVTTLPINGQALTGNASLYIKASVSSKCILNLTYLSWP